jgi:chorismate lyase/3-hydroxybenzoate synthase
MAHDTRLAVVRFGDAPPESSPAPWLEARIPNAKLGQAPSEEVWPASGSVACRPLEGGFSASDGRSLFAVWEIDVHAASSLEAPARELYGRVLRGVTAAGFPHLLRMWNYVPRIHDRSSGMERYMSFCKGRSEAFAAHFGGAFPAQLPAASAVGCPGDRLVVHVLSSSEPGTHVENPRQIPAYRYPPRYGPKSPTFARGTVAPSPWGTLFVSGTASIVGHESLFCGEPARQVEETMRNVEAVLDSAGVAGVGGPLGPRLRSLRIYVRFPDQLPSIQSALARSLGSAVPTTWLQAEICREELLVEIEATAGATCA